MPARHPACSRRTRIHTHHLRRALATATAAALTGGLPPLATATPATAATGQYAADFTGDGYTDLAVGAPGERVGSDPQGSVTFLWGGSSGLSGAAGLPLDSGFYEAGRTLAAGDFDGDGITDLVFGESRNTVSYTQGGVSRTGRPGGMGGFTTPFTNSSTGIASLAAGDVNGDGIADLVVGGYVRSETRETYANSLYLFGKSAQDRTYWGDVANGTQTSIADLDGDGYGDIVTGNPYEPSAWLADTNGDGKADLAIGASWENDSDGAIWSLRGASSGVTASGAVSFGASTLGVWPAGIPRFGAPIAG